MAESDWYYVDVITCAAPNFRRKPGNRYNVGDGNMQTKMKDSDLLAIHEKRLRRILEVALSKSCDTIILGVLDAELFRIIPK